MKILKLTILFLVAFSTLSLNAEENKVSKNAQTFFSFFADKNFNLEATQTGFAKLSESEKREVKGIFYSVILSSATEKNSDEELFFLEVALKFFPNEWMFFARKGSLYYGKNQYNEALSEIDRALSLLQNGDDEQMAILYTARGKCYEKLAELDFAKASLLKNKKN